MPSARHSKTKQFKEYDQKYKHLNGLYERDLSAQDIKSIAGRVDCWPYTIKQFSNEQVQEAVYSGKGVEAWQIFRSCLKGCGTRVKILYLTVRYDELVNKSKYSSELAMLEEIRINNYIGALVRGGQLDKQGNITKEK